MASNNLKISLQEGLREVNALAEEVLEEMRNKQYKLYEELYQMYTREFKCKQMCELLRDYKNKFEAKLKEDMIYIFNQWEDSEGSVCSFLKNVGADDEESMSEARRFESGLRDYLMGLLSKELDEPKEDIADMSGTLDQMLGQVIQLYGQELRSLEETTYESQRQVDNKSEDNFIFLAIGVLLEGILNVNTEFYEELKLYTERDITEELLQQTIKGENGIEAAKRIKIRK